MASPKKNANVDLEKKINAKWVQKQTAKEWANWLLTDSDEDIGVDEESLVMLRELAK